ncbi:MAG: DNA polymerase III subunit gamma/tau [Phycisphaerales bacterium]|nr:MAG: DNA polymerase III subunit gamma/tau [Phycisphaerales bacterium]
MAYQVLARKYRSGTFDDLVGQDAIATTLKNAVATGRVHHGYLFTGTRGVGKTSTARILAKALNCLESKAPTPTPCCKCASCTAIAEGEDIDVIEIDAASNTGVDDIRELRSNVPLRPARGRFKVYVIDEVHMLSTNAFNALLKTLEEPPEHVKFILATTELQKVPATIQSRCQRFSFRAVAPDAIAAHLSNILKAESIRVDDAVVRRLARLANGSIRDALSLTDMVLSFESGHVTTAVLEQVLPPAHDDQLFTLVDHVSTGDAAAALAQADAVFAGGQTVARFCDALIDYLRSLMLLRVCGAATELVDVPEQVRGPMSDQAARFPPPVFVYMITLVEEVRRAARYSGAGRALADAAVVRLAMCHQFTDIATLLRGPLPSAPTAPQPPAAEKKKQMTPGPDAGVDPTRGIAARQFDRADERAAPTTARAVDLGDLSGPQSNVGSPSPAPVRSAGFAGPVRESPRVQVDPTPGLADATRAMTSVASSAERLRVAGDPRVRRAIELVDGTLVDVKRVSTRIPGDDAAVDADVIPEGEPAGEET